MSERLAALRRPRVWLLGLLVVVLGAGTLLALDALGAERALERAQAQTRAATAALSQGDVPRAAEVLDAARSHVDDARSRVDGPVWAVAQRVPLVGRSPRLLVRVVDVADAALTVASEAVEQGEPFLGEDGSIEVSITDGRIDLTPLRLAGTVLRSLPTEDLVVARDRLAATPDTWIPTFVRQGKRDALALADDALTTLTAAVDASTALPTFLGSQEPRRYFLALQNPGELRGTGGFLGLLTVLEVDDGQLRLLDPLSYEVDPENPAEADSILRNHELRRDILVDAPEAFAARYQHVKARGFLGNANVDPHLPMTAPVVMGILEATADVELDGLIALDPVGFERILQVTGPVDVPDQAAAIDPDLPDPIPADRFAEVTLVDAYNELGGRSAARKDYQRIVGAATMSQVLAGGWDGVAFSRALAEIAAERRLQLFSVHEDEQLAFERLGIGGRLRPGQPGHDLIGLSANNAAANKHDVLLGNALGVHVTLGDVRGTSARRDATVRVGVTNPLSPEDDLDEYFLNNRIPRPGRGGAPGPPAWSRTWFTVWTPQDTGFTAGRGTDGQPLDLGAGIIHGHHATDHFLETPPESSNHFEVDLTGPVELVRDGPDLVYRLTVWRQSKAIPDHLDLSITGPDGWGVADVTLEGGGDGQGMGVHGQGNETVRVTSTTDGTVHVAGAATQDVHIEIRYSRGLLDRLWSWIGSPL